jgi:TPP-dependent pyruvate/acetoin dehydrogenase alpha subunit
MNKQELMQFEEEIAEIFNSAKIRSPVHLSSGNEDQILKVFSRIDIKNDWVCGTWRSHYQAMLKGISKEKLKDLIMNGKSMVLNVPEHKFICSSIVGGIPSISVGLALASKLNRTGERVWCWVGDMSAETGAWSEAYRYSIAQQLPITFIVEDNGLGVMSPTEELWGKKWYLPEGFDSDWYESDNLVYYKYKNTKFPHVGAGLRIQF